MTINERAAAQPSRLVRRCYQAPRATIGIWIVAIAIAIAGAVQLKIDTSTASFLDRQSPEWSTYLRSIERHGTDEFIVLAIPSPEPWHVDTLATVIALTDQLEEIPGVRRVDSLASVPLIRDDGGTLMVDAGLASGVPSSDAELRRFVSTVETDRIARDSLVSADGKLFAINVLVENSGDVDWASLVHAVRELARGKQGRVTGVPVFRTEVNARMSGELRVFVPLTLAFLALAIFLVVPSPSAIATPLSVAATAVLCALGAMGYSGVSLSLSTMLLPSTLLALGSAYAMHVVAARGDLDSMAAVAFSVSLSGLTTTIGFVSMAAIPISAIRELAVFGAVGVVAGTLAALSLAPAILSIRPIGNRGSRVSAWIRNSLSEFVYALVIRHRGAVLAIWVILVMVGFLGLARLEVSTDIVKWFGSSSVVRRDYEEIRHQLSGISPVSVLIEAKDDQAPDVHDAAVLAKIDGLSSSLLSSVDIGKTLSIGDPLRALQRAFAGGTHGALPGSNAEVEQSLLLLSGMDRLEDVLHADRRSANILLRVDNNSSDDILELQKRAEHWWSENGDERYEISVTGIMYEFARSEEEIAHGQIQGLAFAGVSIAAVLLIVLRRARVAGVALFANVAPIAIGFGSLGFLGIPLDAGTVCVSSMALGIAVDDTIHVVASYREAREQSATRKNSIYATFRRVLPALLMTTLAISAGFAVLSASAFTLVRNLGVATAALVVLCLIADVTLLPALLLGGKGDDD